MVDNEVTMCYNPIMGRRVLGFVRSLARNELGAVAYYRTYLPLREVNRRAEDISALVVDSAGVMGRGDDELGGFDVYTMSRLYHENCDGFINEVHRRGGVVVLDADDDLTETYRWVSGRGPQFLYAVSKVDYVTVSVPGLATLLAQHTKHEPVVLRNHVDSEWLSRAPSSTRRLFDSVTVGFTGSNTHWGDWCLAAQALARISSSHDIVPLCHGYRPPYLPPCAYIEHTPFQLYPLALAQFDIVLCAVDIDDRYNDGKSAVKALECLALGITPICSRFGPYIELAEAGAPVVIVPEESADGWYEAIADVLDHGSSAAELGPEWVMAHRDISTGWSQWADFYRSIVS